MEIINNQYEPEKQRHGCVTAWLILMIVANSLTAITYFLASNVIVQNFPGNITQTKVYLLAILGSFNVLFAVMLMKWKKAGFIGYIITSVGTLIVNITSGIDPLQSVFGLVGVGVLFAILQIKRNSVSAWENLE